MHRRINNIFSDKELNENTSVGISDISGNLKSSDEGKMEWIQYKDISNIKTVDDFEELLKVMNSDKLSEFQYVVKDDIWNVVLK